MKQILLTIANFMLIDFCNKHKIDCSGSYIRKNGRGFKYELIREKTGKQIVGIEFRKSARPFYSYNPKETAG
jgi:hypothetical protein